MHKTNLETSLPEYECAPGSLCPIDIENYTGPLGRESNTCSQVPWKDTKVRVRFLCELRPGAEIAVPERQIQSFSH